MGEHEAESQEEARQNAFLKAIDQAIDYHAREFCISYSEAIGCMFLTILRLGLDAHNVPYYDGEEDESCDTDADEMGGSVG